MKARFILIIMAVGVLILSGCITYDRPVALIELAFPPGGLWLLIRRDGDTSLSYGELPAYQVVKNGTFDIDEVFKKLETRLYDVVPTGNQPYGLVFLRFSDGSREDYLIYDRAFAKELFKVACANIVSKDEYPAVKLITDECAKLSGTTP